MLKFARENEKVILPTKRKEDAGYDIYAYFEEDGVVINPHTIELIPTGIHTAFNNDGVLILNPRSSTGKLGLGISGGVIDSGYRGEITVPLVNNSDKTILISKHTDKVFTDNNNIVHYPYSKAICQAILMFIPTVNSEEISLEDLKAIPSERGDGALGSSGK